MEYFRADWNVFDVHDINGWDMIMHRLLLLNEIGLDLGMNDVDKLVLNKLWNKIKTDLGLLSYESVNNTNLMGNWKKKREHKNETYIPLDHHSTHSSRKVSIYYNDTNVLKLTIDYVWKDYIVFDIELPEWICGIMAMHQHNNEHDNLRQFLVDKFQQKLYLLPECVT